MEWAGRSHHQANILLSRPSLRGSTPLDIAYSSLMDNTELALAMREHHLEKIAVYLSRCGLTSNAELTAKGYPDLGWVSMSQPLISSIEIEHAGSTGLS